MKEQKQKYFWIVFMAALVLFIVKLDAFVVNVSLPTIAYSFNLNVAQASWVIVIYLLMLTNSLLILGKIEDRIGVKRMYSYGFILFTLGSLFSGLAPDLLILVSARGLQGIGGAMLLITGFGSLNKFLPQEIKGWGLGIVTTLAALGIATGAPLGGFISYFLNWRWIFFLNVPLGLIACLINEKIAYHEIISQKISHQPFDFLGAFLSFIGLTGLTYMFCNGGQYGWFSLTSIITLAASIFIIYLFILWQTKCQNPLMELKIFKNPGFSYANIAVFIIFMILAGVDFIVPFFLQMTKGLNPYQVGLFMFLYSALYSVFSPWAGKLLDKPAFRFLSITSLLVAALLFFGYALTFQHPSLIITFFFFTLWGITNSFLINENMRLVLVNTPSDEQGIGSGIFNIANNLSMVFGVCFFQIIFSHLPNSPVAFRSVFLFAGLLYLFTAVFSRLSEKASGLKSKA